MRRHMSPPGRWQSWAHDEQSSPGSHSPFPQQVPQSPGHVVQLSPPAQDRLPHSSAGGPEELGTEDVAVADELESSVPVDEDPALEGGVDDVVVSVELGTTVALDDQPELGGDVEEVVVSVELETTVALDDEELPAELAWPVADDPCDVVLSRDDERWALEPPPTEEEPAEAARDDDVTAAPEVDEEPEGGAPAAGSWSPGVGHAGRATRSATPTKARADEDGGAGRWGVTRIPYHRAMRQRQRGGPCDPPRWAPLCRRATRSPRLAEPEHRLRAVGQAHPVRGAGGVAVARDAVVARDAHVGDAMDFGPQHGGGDGGLLDDRQITGAGTDNRDCAEDLGLVADHCDRFGRWIEFCVLGNLGNGNCGRLVGSGHQYIGTVVQQ